MKKGRVIAAGTMVLLLTAGVLLAGHLEGCRQRCFNGQGFCSRFCDGRPPLACPGKDFKGFVLSRIDGCVEDLNLSANQKEKYAEMRRTLDENLTRGLERREKLFLQVRKELGRDSRVPLQRCTHREEVHSGNAGPMVTQEGSSPLENVGIGTAFAEAQTQRLDPASVRR